MTGPHADHRGESDLFWPLAILASVAVGFFVYTLLSALPEESLQAVSDAVTNNPDVLQAAGTLLIMLAVTALVFWAIKSALFIYSVLPFAPFAKKQDEQ